MTSHGGKRSESGGIELEVEWWVHIGGRGYGAEVAYIHNNKRVVLDHTREHSTKQDAVAAALARGKYVVGTLAALLEQNDANLSAVFHNEPAVPND